MRSFLTTTVLLALAASAEGQSVSTPTDPSKTEINRWDVAATAAFFNAGPGPNEGQYQDEWYFQDRYGVSLGHYWTAHLKSELDYSISGEGSIYTQEFKPPPAGQGIYPYTVLRFHRLEQAAIRVVWQFGHNSWVHPYVSGGIVGDRERQRTFTPEQYQYLSGRAPERVVPQSHSATTTAYRFGVTAGTGAKIYMSARSFFTTGVHVTWSSPAATVAWLGGLGIDF